MKAELVKEITEVTNFDAIAKIHYIPAISENTSDSAKEHDPTTDGIDNPLVKPSTNDVRATVKKFPLYVGTTRPKG